MNADDEGPAIEGGQMDDDAPDATRLNNLGSVSKVLKLGGENVGSLSVSVLTT